MVPPVTSTPPASGGKPRSPASQRTTCASTRAGAWVKPAMCGFMAAASMSAIIPSGVPLPCTQPQKRGCRLPLG